jgi:hypothetical protein
MQYIPKVGDLVKFTEEFIIWHRRIAATDVFVDNILKKTYNIINKTESIGGQYQLILSPKIFNEKSSTRIDKDNIGKDRIYIAGDGTFFCFPYIYLGKIFLQVTTNITNNNNKYCNCNNPIFISTGFTSIYEVCTKCHLEKRK